MRRKSILLVASAISITLLLMSCSLFSKIPSLIKTNPEATLQAVIASLEPILTAMPEVTIPPLLTEPPGGEVPAGSVPDPLNRLLELRSMRFLLSAALPDGSVRSIAGEIDADGNMLVTYTEPAVDPAQVGEGVVLPEGIRTWQLYLLGGAAYAPSETDPAWRETPVAQDYLPVLQEQLHNLEGFSFWLDLLPPGSLQSAGSETVGGFSASSYAVNGTVSGESITGKLWYDDATHALVKAELHVPAALASAAEPPPEGEILITLDAEKADIAPVTLPAE